ncbi:AfsR/SARP family transcriptional regulator [Oceaniglobus ichthyenteri]|uniref:AfsR/SARP family transcriptional regulator n=1 Tax=Oceaniglobus ichthyenteri TaxID=2136177 RepID=UPI0013DE53F9|nr:BTAD domain-containing putative transcriptional regulator [Oceaniglobus ichthyenteri]
MAGLNAAVILGPGALADMGASLRRDGPETCIIAVTSDTRFQAALNATVHLSVENAGLHAAPFDPATVARALTDAAARLGSDVVIAVDMAWGLETPAASANFDVWGGLCSDLADQGLRIVSLYDWQLLIGDQILAALRGHQHFLAATGLHDNPFWLPSAYLATASLREQVSFLLARTVPDWGAMVLAPGADDQAAVGANPGWLPISDLRPMRGLGQRWKIRCFGRLRVYTSASDQIVWQVPGGAPRKTKALFAYLLTRGERGASAEHMAELLWPDDGDETAKRARLHHTIAMLRKALGGKSFVERRGEYYHLCAPPGSWIDTQAFEQFCRRAKTLERDGQYDAAFALLQAAERLYSGDLFEDLLPEYVENDTEDWCLSQRAWLRDMVLKVHRDMAVMLRKRGNFRDAIKQCRRALALDPTCEIAHEEAMRNFHAQGRKDAIARQYRQFTDALKVLGGDPAQSAVRTVYRDLVSKY